MAVAKIAYFHAGIVTAMMNPGKSVLVEGTEVVGFRALDPGSDGDTTTWPAQDKPSDPAVNWPVIVMRA